MKIKMILIIFFINVSILYGMTLNKYDLNKNYIKKIKKNALLINKEIKNDYNTIMNKTYTKKEKKILLRKYHLKSLKNISLIKKRVKAVNIDILLAQAILESNKGKSRFAKLGNNYLGIWTYDKTKKGIIPKKRVKGKYYRVQKFKTIKDCIYRYVNLLNTNWHYKEYRNLRMITDDKYILINGLKKYAQDKHYINKVSFIMKQIDNLKSKKVID